MDKFLDTYDLSKLNQHSTDNFIAPFWALSWSDIKIFPKKEKLGQDRFIAEF
jgi:hypothetical protein